MKTYSRTEWALEAVKGIILPKERESAKRELLDHMEDHMDALLAAGFSKEDAEKHAVYAMGDPEETAKLLRKAHQPILTRLLQVCKWTVVLLAAALVLQLAVSLFDTHDLPERLWCQDPLTLYGYDYFQTEDLPEDVLARRVADTEGTVDLGDYVLTVQKAALDKMEEGTRIVLLLEMKADRLWDGASIFKGTMTTSCGGETFSQKILNQSYYRRGRSHYHYTVARFTGDLLEVDEVTLDFTNGERSFSVPITLEGGDIHEK